MLWHTTNGGFILLAPGNKLARSTPKTVLEIIRASLKPSISLESIRKSRRWENNPPPIEGIREAIKELISISKIRGDEDAGYTAIS